MPLNSTKALGSPVTKKAVIAGLKGPLPGISTSDYAVGSTPTQAEFNALVTAHNALLTHISTLGLIEASPPTLRNSGATNQIGDPQAFDMSGYWSPFDATVTADATTAPDGTTTADLLVADTVNGNHGIQAGGGGPVMSAGQNTVGVYAKSAGLRRIAFRSYDGTAYRVRTTFDIIDGAVVLDEAGVGQIVALPDGWFFCSTVGDVMGASAGFVIDLLNDTGLAQGTFAGDGVSGVYLWQAQAVTGTSPGPIIYS